MSKFFVATTAIDDFWDKNAVDGIFLGEWCKKLDKKETYRKLNWKMHLDSLTDNNNKKKAMLFCNFAYNRVFVELYKILNKFHGINKEARYWDILLRPWLYLYIQVLYSRYIQILDIKEKYKEIYTFILNKEDFTVIKIPQEFDKKSRYCDLYNLQLYSQVIDFLGVESSKLHIKKIFFLRQEKNSITKIVKKIFNFILSRISLLLNTTFNKNRVLVVSPYFKYNKILKVLKLIIKSKFLFIFDNFDYRLDINKDVNMDARRDAFQIKTQNDFINLVFESFIFNFPIVYLEGYNNFNKNVLRLNIKRPDIIYSANALYDNEIFKFYIARYYHDVIIAYAQHGGNYGIDNEHPDEKIERKIADVYFTYGWENDEKKTRILQQSIFKRGHLVNDQILLVMNIAPQYMCRFVYMMNAADMVKYINNTRLFLLNFRIKDKLVVRTIEDNFWHVQKRLSI